MSHGAACKAGLCGGRQLEGRRGAGRWRSRGASPAGRQCSFSWAAQRIKVPCCDVRCPCVSQPVAAVASCVSTAPTQVLAKNRGAQKSAPVKTTKGCGAPQKAAVRRMLARWQFCSRSVSKNKVLPHRVAMGRWTTPPHHTQHLLDHGATRRSNWRRERRAAG